MTSNLTNWIDEELEQSKKPTTKYEKKPSLKLATDTMTKVIIDFSQPFKKWTDEKERTKAIIPCKVGGKDYTWWLNTKNPVYFKILSANKHNGQTEFDIVTTGVQDKTQYKIIQKVD